MPLSNSATRYGAVAKSLHWLTALLILTLIPLGIYANDLPYDSAEALSRKAWFFSLHKTLGVTVFFVALARILWALTQAKPAPLHPERRLETFLASTVHWLLYGSLLLVPLAGWVHHAATTGFAPIWWPFGQDLPLVPKSDTVAAVSAGLHIVFERVLAISILLHVAGALKHHFIDRDATLRRMLPGRTEAGTGHAPHGAAPMAAALGVWAAALATGAALGAYEKEEGGVQSAALEAVQSDWVVEEGRLEIAVTQLGSTVTGSFADWTADIRFDETVKSGPAGAVEVVIAVGSLTLGSVTSQAMGADFFNAEAYPTATYRAEIIAGPEGYATEGALTLKDQTVQVGFPFSLDLQDGVARVSGSTALDRRDYGIGTQSQPTESNVGFGVDVSLSITARETAE